MKPKFSRVPADEIKLPGLIFGELAAWIGSSFIWPLTSVYLNKQLHISLTIIGWVLFTNCAGNLVASLIAGKLYDRFNPYPLVLFGFGSNTVVLFLLAFFHGWPEYWIWLTLTGFLGGWTGTIINSIATSLKRYPSRYVFNILYFSQNLGVVIGTLIVGYLYAFSVKLLFLIAAFLYLIAFITAAITFRPIIKYHQERLAKGKTGKKIKAVPMPKYNLRLTIGLFASLAVTWLMYMNWESNLSVYMVSLGIPFHMYSTLWTLNASIIVIVQAILARFQIFKTLYLQILFGLTMFAISFVTLAFAKDYLHFALSMVILTLGESTAFPAIPALVNELTPNSSKGNYQGMSLVASATGRAFGAEVGGGIIDTFGYIPLFAFAAAAIFLMPMMLIPLYRSLRDKLEWFS
ncbi:MDR family MFS transporter [Lactobacillus corticis]|uniref:Major facilitator superfamily transporter n=1 Tax=Lactobacillus corticis TaxID=2201249 RepID=A0A916VIP1_9LACO|nr:MFS transporter [Lactobacillus corticis]GFZ27690.1 major facilitator superfamily transporter [Lactobacillus corticis]